jgi:hypothetical protein
MKVAHHQLVCQPIRLCFLRQFVVAIGRVLCAAGSMLWMLLAHAVGAAIDIKVIALQSVTFVIVTTLPLCHAVQFLQFI